MSEDFASLLMHGTRQCDNDTLSSVSSGQPSQYVAVWEDTEVVTEDAQQHYPPYNMQPQSTHLDAISELFRLKNGGTNLPCDLSDETEVRECIYTEQKKQISDDLVLKVKPLVEFYFTIKQHPVFDDTDVADVDIAINDLLGDVDRDTKLHIINRARVQCRQEVLENAVQTGALLAVGTDEETKLFRRFVRTQLNMMLAASAPVVFGDVGRCFPCCSPSCAHVTDH